MLMSKDSKIEKQVIENMVKTRLHLFINLYFFLNIWNTEHYLLIIMYTLKYLSRYNLHKVEFTL